MQVSRFLFLVFEIFATPKECFLSGPKNELEMTVVHLGTGSASGSRGDPGRCGGGGRMRRRGACFRGVILQAPEGLDLQRLLSFFKNPEDIWQNVRLC